MSITAMKQAVATLKGRLDHPDASDTITSLLAAIAEEEACVPVLCVSSRSFARMRAGDDRINAWFPPATEAEDMPLYTTPQPAPKQEPIPPGYQLVPVEPTDKMVQASLHLDLSYMPLQEGYDRAAVYKAMLAAAPVQAQPAKPLTCTWTPMDSEDMPGTYDTACGRAWSFVDGGPAENDYHFCHGCGHPVEIKEQP